jgi:hypothetical protein
MAKCNGCGGYDKDKCRECGGSGKKNYGGFSSTPCKSCDGRGWVCRKCGRPFG